MVHFIDERIKQIPQKFKLLRQNLNFDENMLCTMSMLLLMNSSLRHKCQSRVENVRLVLFLGSQALLMCLYLGETIIDANTQHMYFLFSPIVSVKTETIIYNHYKSEKLSFFRPSV